MQRLEPRVRWLWTGGAAVAALVVGGVAVAIAVLALDHDPAVGVGLGALVFVLGAIHAFLRFRAFRYEVQDDALYIERGVFTQVRTVVPYVRVQHVDTQRNPIERLVGLGRVVVYTAGSRGADVAIPGLTPERATELQQRLRTLAGESDPTDAV